MPDVPSQTIPSPALREGALDLPGGVRLSYAERNGAATGPAVVLLHGFTDSWRCWRPVMDRLPARLRVLAVSLRGHGDSAAPPGAGFAPAAMAGDVARLIAARAAGPALVVGHCMGAQVAQRLALDHPGLVRGLVLIGAYATLRGNAVVAELWRDAVCGLTDPVDPGFVRAFQAGTLARPVPPVFLDGVVAESLKLPAVTWRAVLAAILAEPAPEGLGRLAGVPTLLAWGAEDGLVPPEGRAALAASIPGAAVEVVPGGGHSPHWEDPGAAAAMIAGWAGG
jgi:pimeloyl-ACP methyl ester carboxylesterase